MSSLEVYELQQMEELLLMLPSQQCDHLLHPRIHIICTAPLHELSEPAPRSVIIYHRSPPDVLQPEIEALPYDDVRYLLVHREIISRPFPYSTHRSFAVQVPIQVPARDVMSA